MAEKIRIQKYLAMHGAASRRGADKMVEEGKVRINRRTAVPGDMVTPGEDEVFLEGRRIGSETDKKVYIMLNKPRGCITSTSDDRGRKTVIDLLSDVPVRVSPVGRLDYNSEGLLLLSNDGDFIYRMTHPKHHISKKYHVLIQGKASEGQMIKLSRPMKLDGYITRGANVSRVSMKGDNEVLCIEIFEGRNRQIRRMCDETGLFVKRLKRISVGLLELGDLKTGHYRYLNPAELAQLQDITRDD